MTTISIRALKAGLSACLQRVRRGERIVVTSRGKPVATIAPIRAVEGGDEDARLARLAAEGVLTPPQTKAPTTWQRAKAIRGKGGARVLEALLEERRKAR